MILLQCLSSLSVCLRCHESAIVAGANTKGRVGVAHLATREVMEHFVFDDGTGRSIEALQNDRARCGPEPVEIFTVQPDGFADIPSDLGEIALRPRAALELTPPLEIDRGGSEGFDVIRFEGESPAPGGRRNQTERDCELRKRSAPPALDDGPNARRRGCSARASMHDSVSRAMAYRTVR